ncbi:MAG: PP2C family serine/threonine-protein phosphatase, partial [Chromatiaceae bacterium]
GQPPDLAVTERLLGAITAANQVVHNLARATAGEGEVGTTLVAAAIHQGHLFWIGAGDSRLYLYRAADGSLTPCNEEHNLALQLWRQAPADGPTPDWIEDHPQRHALISFLGLAEIPEIDRNVRPLALEAGDRLLLCSDGVDGVLSLDELKDGLDADPQTAAEGLIARLQGLQRLYQDNATVAILACEGWDTPTRVSDGVCQRRWPGPAPWALALVLLMLVMGLGVGWWQWWTPAPPALEANDPASSVQAKPAMAEPVLDPAPEGSVPPSASSGAEVSPVKADTSDEKNEASKPLETSQ